MEVPFPSTLRNDRYCAVFVDLGGRRLGGYVEDQTYDVSDLGEYDSADTAPYAVDPSDRDGAYVLALRRRCTLQPVRVIRFD